MKHLLLVEVYQNNFTQYQYRKHILIKDNIEKYGVNGRLKGYKSTIN